jgi:hypothetical protein
VGGLWLEAEAREGTVDVASERRIKHGTGERNPDGGSGSTLLKGGGGDTTEGGVGGGRVTHGGA